MTEISSLSRKRNARAHKKRERENKRSKTKRTTTHSDMIAFFLSSLLGFYNTSLCPYVFYHTRLDVMTTKRKGNFSSHQKFDHRLLFSLHALSLLTHKNSYLLLSAFCKKKKERKRNVSLFVIFSLLFTVFL